MREHAGRLPVVLGVRVLRQLGLWQPMRAAVADLQLHGAARPLAAVAVAQYALYAGVALLGTVLLRRRGRPLLPLGAVLGMTVLLAMMAYGTLRFRVALDAVLPVPAAVAVVAGAARLRAPSRRAAGDAGDDTPAPGPARRSADR